MFERALLLLGLVVFAVACGTDLQAVVPQGRLSLAGSCVETATVIPSGALRCGAQLSLECGARPGPFFVTSSELGATSCAGAMVEASPRNLAVGTTTVTARDVSGAGGPADICTAQVTVEDTEAPSVLPHRTELWSPNHMWSEITPSDCADVMDSCGATTFRFTGVAVDEPVNDRGDGNTDPDVEVGCDRVRVRAERQGGGDGRVYRLDFEVEDDAGNVATGTCEVVVPPNGRGGGAVWSGEAYRVDATADCMPASPGPCEPPEYEGLNTGPLPSACAKTEGGNLGTAGLELGFGTETATFTNWRSKNGNGRGEYVGFEVTLTSTPAWISVKAGGDVFGERLEGGLTHTWVHPNGTSGPSAKGISNIVLCAEEACNPPDGGRGRPDAGVSGGADAGSGGSHDLGSASDASARPDAGIGADAGRSDAGEATDGGFGF